jgi:uncharacterized Tic20 family protein
MEERPTQSFLNESQTPVYTPTSDEKTMAILSHVLTFVSSILAPLIIYLIKKDDSPYVATHAKESLNFQITACIISFVLIISVIGIFLLWLLWLGVVICVIIATIKASENKIYRYPLTIRFIK